MRLYTEFQNQGATAEGSVPVDISYDIIRAVSSQLYTTPRKAIEELICNSYDAGATECNVTVPLEGNESLLVLDNGKSMDFAGIKELWHVAHSPKAKKRNDLRIANDRMQIGKFGVGKLAAFALGERLTHVACVKNTVRIISVGQNEIKNKAGRRPNFKVYRMPLGTAKGILAPRLADLPKPWEKGWPNWTLAMVEEIDPSGVGAALNIGLLKRMIKTALPVSSKFKVILQGELVPRRTIDPNKIAVRVDVLDPQFRKQLSDALQDYWAVAMNEDPANVPANRYTLQVREVPVPEQTSKTVKALVVPSLGPVIGHAISAKTSLTTEKLQERGYSDNGFAVTAYGKLVNPEDPLFGITQRSHKYWSKFLAQVEMPGLDRVLLVQRNAVSENSPEAQIAREVLRTLFNYTRTLVEEVEGEPGYNPGSFGHRLGSVSPILAQVALQGLLRGTATREDLGKLTIEFGTFGVAGPPVRFDSDARAIIVNQEHPLLSALDDLGPAAKQMRRVLGEVLAGIEVGKGYLWSRGVKEDIIIEVGEVIDAGLRSAAEFVRDPVEEHIKEIRDASFAGDRPFEKAVVQAFRSLRLAANHYGDPDQPDGIIEIPRSGTDNLRISIEAKGSKGVITHKELSEATVRRHNEEFQCQYGVAIAREFSKDGIGGKASALLRETKGKLPLLTVDGIALMLRLHKRRNFTYDKIITILTTWTHPDDLTTFIHKTWSDMPELGLMRLILSVAHDQCSEDSTNLPEPGGIVRDPRIIRMKIKKEAVITVLESVALTTGMITFKDLNDYRFELNAPVDTILEAMQASYQADPRAKA